MIAKQLTWHLTDTLNTPQEDITKIRMKKQKKVTYLNVILRILKKLDINHYGVEGESGTAFFCLTAILISTRTVLHFHNSWNNRYRLLTTEAWKFDYYEQ